MDGFETQSDTKGTPLKRGWTTGACATAATKSALSALLGAGFEDPVCITLPGGQTPSFALAHEAQGTDWAEAGIVKDAGDDPDVTHGALIIVRVQHGPKGSGITFEAGAGVGTVTKPGLPLAVGEPAINPVPRKMMSEAVHQICATHNVAPDFCLQIGVPDGANIAQKTWNPRLGILGGISILGTTGIVIPYSCSAWIHSIHRGVDVARAMGLTHLVGATGDASEKAARKRLDLADEAYLDMGDFVGGTLKYIRQHPVEEVTIAGGFAKLSKLAQGAMDLHSGRSQVDMNWLADLVLALGGTAQMANDARASTTASGVLQLTDAAGLPLGATIAQKAQAASVEILRNPSIRVRILVTNRAGNIVGEAN